MSSVPEMPKVPCVFSSGVLHSILGGLLHAELAEKVSDMEKVGFAIATTNSIQLQDNQLKVLLIHKVYTKNN